MITLPPLLILTGFITLFTILVVFFRIQHTNTWRLAFIEASIFIGGLTWLFTESLSIIQKINFPWLGTLWGITFITIMIVATPKILNNRKFLINEFYANTKILQWLSIEFKISLIFATVSVITSVIVIFLLAPSNWDSMTYHLSRVVHWHQNQSLDFYATNILRQLHLVPFAEVSILNFYVLTGNDRLANFVQFFAMLGCVIGSSVIVRFFRMSVYYQLFAAILVFTIPMGLMQSATTKNDYVAAFWTMCFVIFTLKQILSRTCIHDSLVAGISLGLAINTKSTAILFTAPFGIWLALSLFQQQKIKTTIHLAILLFVATAIITPHSFRNLELYGNPLGPMAESPLDGKYKYTNDIYSLSTLTSNIFRNIALHLVLPIEPYNKAIELFIIKAHDFLKIDVYDTRTTWSNTYFRVAFGKGENFTGNFLHFLLMIFATFGASKAKKEGRIYFLCLITGFLLFCLMLRWQPWHSRLHLPLFVLSAPFISYIFSITVKKKIINYLVLIVCVYAIPFLPNIANTYFLADRTSQYFLDKPDLEMPYREIFEHIEKLDCQQVGLKTGWDDGEYLFWSQNQRTESITFKHVFVDNISRHKQQNNFTPCVIIFTTPSQDEYVFLEGIKYKLFIKNEAIALFAKTTP
jgi:hypothetical protein